MGHLQEDALELPDGDVVDGAGAELAAELLCCEAAEVVDVVGPQVEHVVAREPVTLLHHHNPAVESWVKSSMNFDPKLRYN